MSSRLIKIHKSSRQLELYEGNVLLRRFPLPSAKPALRPRSDALPLPTSV
ncbi:MAG: hypothetical protein ACYCV0_02175 [Desulfitobacteriaceae bacterium]